MDALIDTNVLINFITGRDDPFRDECSRIMELCAEGRFTGYMAFHSLSTIWYVVRKHKSDEESRFWLENLCDLLIITGTTQEEVIHAIRNRDFKDFEDCLQDKCAKAVHADYIVTGNIKDYRQSEIRAVTPDEFLSLIGEKE